MANENKTTKVVDEAGELAAAVKVPAGDILVRRVRGVDGLHPIGHVSLGRLYTISMAAAVIYCVGEAAEFEPVLKADRAAIDAASKEAKQTAEAIATKEKELAGLKAGN